ncbi:MAG: hypothetical protein ETSY1_15360 [Candidatus Entotheonella factor]|uniref:Uncharacterized protein n=1 Tax=Entotheonella factor TaxID=1429438 RepID=W4LPL3_ENTF1|nr:MAG: hypothetical protein ETSY1_15360 [Candidatus Entotheonella factor]
MFKKHSLLILIGLSLVASAAFASFEDRSIACYELSTFPNERYKLNIEPHSFLTSGEEEGYKQFTFSVHGNHVGTCGDSSVRTVVGTIVSTVPFGRDGKVRMGLVSFNTTGVPNFCRDVKINCISDGRTSFPPRKFKCFGQNQFDAEFEFRLRRVNEKDDLKRTPSSRQKYDQIKIEGNVPFALPAYTVAGV